MSETYKPTFVAQISEVDDGYCLNYYDISNGAFGTVPYEIEGTDPVDIYGMYYPFVIRMYQDFPKHQPLTSHYFAHGRLDDFNELDFGVLYSLKSVRIEKVFADKGRFVIDDSGIKYYLESKCAPRRMWLEDASGSIYGPFSYEVIEDTCILGCTSFDNEYQVVDQEQSKSIFRSYEFDFPSSRDSDPDCHIFIQHHYEELEESERKINKLTSDNELDLNARIKTYEQEREKLLNEMSALKKANTSLRKAENQKDDLKKELEACRKENEMDQKALEDIRARMEKMESDVEDIRLSEKAPVYGSPDAASDECMFTPYSGEGTDPIPPVEIVDQVAKVLKAAGRRASRLDIVNYLICFTQGFITTFAGIPGTGKTSLCNLLAKSLGLDSDNDEVRRFVDVSVERGWSNPKDLIGFWNSLLGREEKSNVEVFDAFKMLDKEMDAPEREYPPFLMLLDEANLSSMEHYWAAFFRMCDFDSSRNRTLSLGGTLKFRVPPYMRFFATVNFDHTTEELSPRFLDRSWVIMLKPEKLDIINADESEKALNQRMVTMRDLENGFRRVRLEDEEVLEVWKGKQVDDKNRNKGILDIFHEHGMDVSQRNRVMIEGFCGAGIAYLKEDPDAAYTPLHVLDRAVSEKLLPSISGSSENVRKLVEDLLAFTYKKLPETNRNLKRMKDDAENNVGYYTFFTR